MRFRIEPDVEEYSKTVENLKQNSQIKYVLPFFERGNNPIGTSDVFYVQLKDLKDTILLVKIAEHVNMRIIKQISYMPLWYILSIRNSTFDNAVEAANYFYETGYFEDIDPAFMFNFEANCTDDPLFGQMWGLKNTANPGIDINICNAWTITKGAGIKVAVADQGIYRSHMDLAANIHPLSFDAQSGMSPSVFTGESHGTHVAGTIAAVKNELQVVGVAPESKLIGVSHDLYVTATMSAELASGINWAWQDGVGADIINCSFGDQGSYFYDEFHSTALEKAISNAMSQETGQLALQETGKNFCADFQINMSAIPNGLYLVSTDFSTMVN